MITVWRSLTSAFRGRGVSLQVETMKIVDSFEVRKRGTVWCVDAKALGLAQGATVRRVRNGATWFVTGVEEPTHVGQPVGLMLQMSELRPALGDELEIV